MTDEAVATERSLKERKKDRREVDAEDGVETAGSAADDAGTVDYTFGYGGWTVSPAGEGDVSPSGPMILGADDAADADVTAGGGSRLRQRLRARRMSRGDDDTLAEDDFAGQGDTGAPGTAAVEPWPDADEGRETGTAAALPVQQPVIEPVVQRVATRPQADEEDRPIIAAPPPPRRPAAPPRDLRPDPSGPRDGRASPRRARRERSGGRDKREEAAARQRQAPRIEGGGTVMIADVLYPLVDWSTGGIAIASEGQRYRVGDFARLELELDLGDYAVNLDLDGEVANRSADRTGWRFLDPTPLQTEVLRSLARASLEGHAFAAPTGSPGERPRKKAWRQPRPVRPLRSVGALVSLLFNLVIIALATGAGVYVLNDGKLPELPPLAAVQETSAPTPVTAERAAVAVESLPLLADRAGVVLEWGAAPGEAVDNGEALVSLGVTDPDSDTDRDVIESPCDCFLARILAQPGRSVTAGQVIARLYRRGSQGHVQALFAPGEAPAIGERVSVELPFTEDTFEGVVESVGRLDASDQFIGLPASLLKRRAGRVFARITTTPPVPAALAGDPAEVTTLPGEKAVQTR